MKSKFLLSLVFCVPSIFCGGCHQEKETIVVLVRHGQSTANVDGTLAGRRSDVELTDVGYAQASALGKTLSQKGQFDAFYCSSLKRAKETGKTVLSNMNASLEPIIETGLDDVDYGEATGMLESTAVATYGGVTFPKDFGPIDEKDFKPTFTGENTYQWFSRFKESMNKIASSETGKRVLVVSHGASYYWGQQLFGEDKVPGLSNCGYAELSYKRGNWSLIEWHQESPNI